MSGAVDRERFDALVADGWLRSQRHPEADLWIYNYTERTQYENHWTPETLMSRGLIVGARGEIVARPFRKFFNYGTPQAFIPGERFSVWEKVDGSLGIFYRVENESFVATRGSFTSEQAKVGTQLLRERYMAYDEGTTPLFEIVYPENRIVVDYGDLHDLILLGCVDNSTGRDAPLPDWDGSVAEEFDHPDIDALADLQQPNREGFVVAFESGHRVKVKFEEYVRLHKIVTGINARRVWESLRAGDDLDALLEGVPDEVHQWVSETRRDLMARYGEIEGRAQEVFDARPDAERKELAGYFMSSGASPAVLFAMLDGKDYSDRIWMSIKPESEPPALWGRTGAVA